LSLLLLHHPDSTQLYTLSLHDALPIYFLRAVKAQDDETVVLSWIIWKDRATRDVAWEKMMDEPRFKDVELPFDGKRLIYGGFNRSEEHTSELQSRENLVCRLLLEKKKA